MSIVFEQHQRPKDPEVYALTAVGRCSCGFDIWGETIEQVKGVFGEMKTCPVCGEHL